MATKDLKDDEIQRFLRFSVTESAAATFTQESYDTQLAIDRGLIWMINLIEIDLNTGMIDMPSAGAGELIKVQITRESKSAIINYDDTDLITGMNQSITRGAAIGTDAGPLYTSDFYPKVFHYEPPLPFAAQNIYVGILSTSGSAQTVHGRIGYTLRCVTDKFFYRVAQALIS